MGYEVWVQKSNDWIGHQLTEGEGDWGGQDAEGVRPKPEPGRLGRSSAAGPAPFSVGPSWAL